MSRKLNMSATLPITFETEQLQEDLSKYDTIRIDTREYADSQLSTRKEVFYATTQVYPGDLFTARHVSRDGKVTTYTIRNPTIVNFRANFDAIQQTVDTKLAIDVEDLMNVDNADEEITYESVLPVPHPPRRPLKRTWAKIGQDLVDAMTKTDELMNYRPAKIQKLN